VSTKTILVIGATGTVGSETVRQLHAAGHSVRALVRDAAKASALLPGVDIFIGDLAKPETLVPAFDGAAAVFVISNGTNIAELEHEAYVAAKAAGVSRIVKLSGRHVDASFLQGYPLQANQNDSETELRGLGIPWTIIRPGYFSSNFLGFIDPVRNEVMLPVADGCDTPTDPRDIAAVAALALTQDGHDGQIYEITGPEFISYRAMIALIAEATGRPLALVDVSDADAQAGLESVGLPSTQAAGLVRYFKGVRDGEIYPPTDTIERLLGRPPLTFEQWVRATYSNHSNA
jgi:uncharacterized protein YbjT (DUF2867 family)